MSAKERATGMSRLHVVSAEGLIGFKLQGFVNDATRTRDPDDIRALLQADHGSLDLQELRRYVALLGNPQQVPGGEYTVHGHDPEGARFGLVGPRREKRG